MSLLRYVALSLSALFGLYCVIWGLVAPSLPTVYRIDGIFFGGLLLLLAFVHFRFLLSPKARGDHAL